MLPSPEGGHTAAHEGKQRVILWGTLTGRHSNAGGSGCARLQRASFLRRRGPAGLRSLFFGYSVVIFALPVVYPKRGNN